MGKQPVSFSNPFFPRLSPGQCARVHEASLEILERVGVRLELEEAVRLLKRAGAWVGDDHLVRVPSRLVDIALSTVPKRVTLCDRNGRPVVPIEGWRSFYGTGSDCLNLLDHRTGQRRKPLLSDLNEGVILCDALPEIDFVMSMVLPSDVDGTIADRFQMEAMLSGTTKPIVFVAYQFEGCLDCVEMAEIVAGSAEALQRNPSIACYINIPSGLVHNQDSLQKLLYLSSKGLPALYIPSSTGGATSPVTPAGALALDCAGVLVGLVLSQLTSEGAPLIVPGMVPGNLDMRTMVSTYAEPERGYVQALARSYGLPMFSLGGASDSKITDQQAAAEAALTLLVESMAGGHLVHDLGYLESGLTFSFVQLAICAEIVSWIQALSKPIEVSDETLAVDLIAGIAPDGEFLNTAHTLKHFRHRWYPTLFERNTFESWLAKGGKTLGQRSAERIDKILAQHRPEQLPEKTRDKLRAITRRAQERRCGGHRR